METAACPEDALPAYRVMPTISTGLVDLFLALVQPCRGLQCWQLSQGPSGLEQSPAQMEIGAAALVVFLGVQIPLPDHNYSQSLLEDTEQSLGSVSSW